MKRSSTKKRQGFRRQSSRCRTVLLIVDVINDLNFPGNEELIKRPSSLGQNVAGLKKRCKKKQDQVFASTTIAALGGRTLISSYTDVALRNIDTPPFMQLHSICYLPTCERKSSSLRACPPIRAFCSLYRMPICAIIAYMFRSIVLRGKLSKS